MTMKALRPWLLLLLAVLLPLRGAVAASMACALPAPVAAMAMAFADDAHAHHHHEAEPHDTAPQQHHATADKCNLCAAAGAATPLPMRSPELQQPMAGAVLLFPPLAVRVTGFVPDGLERPPRAG